MADIGLYGGALHVDGHLLPIYHLLANGDGFAHLVARVPVRRAPQAVACLVDAYRSRRLADESLQAFVRRVPEAELRDLLTPVLSLPSFAEDPGEYFDWEAGKPFSLDERGEGECSV